MNKKEWGARAEEAAADRYGAEGYAPVARNYRYRRLGEIDLIMQKAKADDGMLLVFCEVKYRSDVAFAPPSSAVTPAKQQRIRRVCASFLQQNRSFQNASVRFDIAEVTLKNGNFIVNILENAF